ncbi:MAG TPA: NADH-quinone oxidoreductase subunit C [Caldimonas sp.]|nr:NADH-quinone oxidoreductase subunit C [Caldimonas sp.]
MQIPGLTLDLERLPAPLPIWRGSVDADAWQVAARAVTTMGGRLVALWGADRGTQEPGGLAVCAAYALADGLVWLDLALPADSPIYPDLSTPFPCAIRMQRAAADLLGIVAAGARDKRPWLDHGAWPADQFPLHEQVPAGAAPDDDAKVIDYPFVRVAGDGVHEIPVGPVHAGVIEPGHFRFSVVGEKVLRLEERLGYTHKGIEKRFTQLAPLEAHRLASRVSGDSTVAYAWAYCMALESAAGLAIPARAGWLRALLLERERVANHLGDLGALGNDAALAFGLAQFSRLREDWLRLSKEVFGHRLMMDRVVPGGTAVDVDAAAAERLSEQCGSTLREAKELRSIYDEHAGLQDRFIGTGQVSPELAAQLGLTGLAGRASGLARDLRRDHPWPPYDSLDVSVATHRAGDVGARVAVRFVELFESLRLIRAILAGLPTGAHRVDVRLGSGAAVGAGWVEGWRGEVFVALELDAAGSDHRIRRCHCHDPSWQNWPVLEHAVIGNIVPDFPLINKSFNLSYSGHDL